MKIIHCADIHIGAVLKNLPFDKTKIRRREIIDSFYRMVEYASKENIEVIIIAGDFFDGKRVAKSIIKEIFDKISHFSKIDFLYLVGNHDNMTDLSFSDVIIPDNFKYFDDDSNWKHYNYKNVCIAGIDIIKQKGLGFYDNLDFDKNKFNIAVLHGDLSQIDLSRLKSKNIDYLALGDIHIPDINAKKLDARGYYGYSGCLESKGYDEIGKRGFFVLDTESPNFSRVFVSTAKREYINIDLDITGLDSHSKIEQELNNKIDDIDKNNILRVTLVGKKNADTQIEKDNLEKKLIDKFFYAKVKDTTSIDMMSVDFSNEISLRSEFVKVVNKSNLTEEEKDKVIEYGIKALYGEDIDLCD